MKKHILINTGRSKDVFEKAYALLIALGYTDDRGQALRGALIYQRDREVSLVARTNGRIEFSETKWFREQDAGDYAQLPELEFAPVKLKVGAYDTTIDKESRTVKVGCQTFPFEKVRELAAAINGTETWTPMSEAARILGPIYWNAPVTALRQDGTTVKTNSQAVYNNEGGQFKGFQVL